MFQEITYMPDPVFGKPLIMWGGGVVLLLLITTAAVGYVTIKGIRRFPVSWHVWLARFAISLGLMHAVLGMLAYF